MESNHRVFSLLSNGFMISDNFLSEPNTRRRTAPAGWAGGQGLPKK